MNTFDVTVRGLGFTGLATAVAAVRAGFRVAGVDRSAERVREISDVRAGCGLTTVSETELRAQLSSKMLRVHDMSSSPPTAAIHVICVPTPSGNSSGADLSSLLNAVDSVASTLRRGDLVLVQSTCPPGTTERLLLPRLAERSGLSVGTGFHLAYSPVRLDPGVRRGTLRNVPRVLAGVTPACRDRARDFLDRITDQVVPVTTVRTAELVKVFENTFRLVNISLANEMAAVCQESAVDPVEVLDAAATKPYGFLRHRPGPGAGGDCVPVSAGFFAAAARREGVSSGVVDAAIALNDAMPGAVVRRVQRLLHTHRLRPLAGRRVLVLGVTYKPDVPNVRGSAGVRVVELLRSSTDVAYHDPYVPRLRLSDGSELRSEPIDRHGADLVLVLTRHHAVEHGRLAGGGATVVDCATGEPKLITEPPAASTSDEESGHAR